MTEHTQIIYINKKPYLATDIGCPDFEQAERNRKMVANKENIAAYLAIERMLQGVPSGKPLPPGVPIGELPSASTGGYRLADLDLMEFLDDADGGNKEEVSDLTAYEGDVV